MAYSAPPAYTEGAVEGKGFLPRRPVLHQWPLRVGAAVLLGILGGAVLIQASRDSPGPPGPTRTIRQSPTIQPTVPPLIGITAAQARRALVGAGLILEDLVPARARPGNVVGSVPSQGRVVAPGTAVTLFVGVDRHRFRMETRAAN
jgi:PASTA domain